MLILNWVTSATLRLVYKVCERIYLNSSSLVEKQVYLYKGRDYPMAFIEQYFFLLKLSN